MDILIEIKLCQTVEIPLDINCLICLKSELLEFDRMFFFKFQAKFFRPTADFSLHRSLPYITMLLYRKLVFTSMLLWALMLGILLFLVGYLWVLTPPLFLNNCIIGLGR